MEEIIKKAIEGGWKKGWRFDHCDSVFVFMQFMDTDVKQPLVSWMKERLVCDPLFWQALSKACGWNEKDYVQVDEVKDGVGMLMTDGGDLMAIWKANALRFHEINLTEGWDAAVEYISKTVRGTALVN